LIEYSLKENLRRLQSIPFNDDEPASFDAWAMFIGFQLLDIYSTAKAIKYDCLKEGNPLLPAQPQVWEMLALKLAILIPQYQFIHEQVGFITNEDLIVNTTITGVVVHNNFQLLDYAENNCNLR
jgi:hypothetical protein